MDDPPMPKHHYLADGRLLCWYWTAHTGHVERFRIGRDDITTEEGLQLLAAENIRRDGKLLGPLQEPRRSAISRRRRGR